MNEHEDTFESALTELESIVDSLERDDLELDQALTLFERGIERLRVAARFLDAAHGRVEELVQDAAGSVAIVPLDIGDGDTNEPGVE